MRIVNLIISLCLLLSCSCSSDSLTGELPSKELISRITAVAEEDNVLRYHLAIEARHAVSIEVEYWKRGEETQIQRVSSPDFQTFHDVTLLFLEAETPYEFRVKASTGNAHTTSAKYGFTTAQLPYSVPRYNVGQSPQTDNEVFEGVVLVGQQSADGYLVMLNREGKVVWYHKTGATVNCSNYDARTQTITCLLGNNTQKMFTATDLKVFDLYGRELMHKHYTELKNPYIHHDARRLANGDIAVINFVAGTFDLSKYGGASQQTVYGDGITIYDMEGHVKAEWSCFSEMTPDNDSQIMDSFPGAMDDIKRHDDWLHANSVAQDSEGNLYVSFHFINQIWKIDLSTGKVGYRAGRNGNTTLPEAAYTEGVHSVGVDAEGVVSYFDNGVGHQQSRYVAIKVDEEGRRAELRQTVTFPETFCTQFMGNAAVIGDNKIMLGSSMRQAIVVTDFDGEPIWVCRTPHRFFRAQHIATLPAE